MNVVEETEFHDIYTRAHWDCPWMLHREHLTREGAREEVKRLLEAGHHRRDVAWKRITTRRTYLTIHGPEDAPTGERTDESHA